MKHYDLPEDLDLNNKEFKTLWQIINTTNQSVFLTGKAGTGKSTFLKYICANTKKKFVVLAPTGIAAVNVGGMTLHSFFKIPFKPLLPDDPEFSAKNIRKRLNYTREKIKILQELDLIIIDEISMVRADIIDFIDRVLRYYCRNTREPFGGKQILFVGDVFQLEPVITSDMKEILKKYYRQMFFFNANVFSALSLIPIELIKIYRQKNAEFVSILDRVRIDKATDRDLAMLNSRIDADYQAESGDLVITLATKRDVVDSINNECMSALTTPEHEFEGTIKDDFPEQNLPTSKTLILKEGAQIIFVKNDREQRWVNGTIGRIIKIEDDDIRIELEDGTVYSVEKEIWENMRYSYDDKKKEITEKLLGTFTQYPIKPAWALTVHKSQGLTFNKVIINLKGGAFACGQTYVALSRCTSLGGLTLRQNIRPNDILVNPAVIDFSHKFNDSAAINRALEEAKANNLFIDSLQSFKDGAFNKAFDLFLEGSKIKDIQSEPLYKRFISLQLDSLSREIAKLKYDLEQNENTFEQLAHEYVQMGKDSLLYLSESTDKVEENYGEDTLNSIPVKSAMANYEKALRISPMCIEAYEGIGDLYFKCHKYDTAIIRYREILKNDSKNPDIYTKIGDCYYAKKEYEDSAKMYFEAVKLDKRNSDRYDTLARALDKGGDEELADKMRQQAMILRKKNK